MDEKSIFSKQTVMGQSGSSLIGVAILTLAMGFLITGAIHLMQNYDMIQSDQKSIDYSRNIEDALKNFVAMEGRYPCPAPFNAAIDTAEFGKEDGVACAGAPTPGATFRVNGRDPDGAGPLPPLTIRVGAIPVRDLNIPDAMIADGYKKRYIYAVTENLVNGTENPTIGLGGITINDQDGISVSDTPGYVVYALISPGEDDRGTYDINGNLLEPCDIEAMAGNNCDFINPATADATFVTTTKSFGVGLNTFTHNFAFHANSMAYRWHVDPWSDCNGVCNAGTQTRTFQCRDTKNDPADPLDCAHTPTPIDSRSCPLPPCTWGFGNCVGGGSCGGGGNDDGGDSFEYNDNNGNGTYDPGGGDTTGWDGTTENDARDS